MSLYRNILKQAWQIAWRNKYLWFFGFFAALIANGVEQNVVLNSLDGSSGIFPGCRRIAETGIFSHQALNNVGQIMRQDPISMLMIMVFGILILILAVYLLWLAVVSQAALISGSAEIISGKKPQKSGIQNGVTAGVKNFWPIFGLNAIIKISVIFIFYLISLPLILTAGKASAAVNFTYVIAFLILLPVALVITFIIKYAMAYIVVRGSGFFESISQGWHLFMDNWLISLEMAFILFFISLLAGLAIGLIILALLVPFALLAFILLKIVSTAAFWLVVMLGFAVIMAVIIIAGSVLTVFQISSWTGLFVELIGKGGISKIVRLSNKLFL